MGNNFKFYGIKEYNTLTSDADSHVEEIKLQGYTVFENLLEEPELQAIRSKINQIYQIQIDEVGGENRLKQINDAYVVRCLLAYDEYFLGLAANSKILHIVEALLGDYFTLTMQNGIINRPDVENYQSSWHRDLNYQHFVSSRPLAVSALFCVDHFSTETGGTYVLPASHKAEVFPSREFVQRYEQPIQARAGSVLIFDSMLFHRAGHNTSTSVRRAINHVYSLPFIKQQISLPEALNGKYKDDPFLSRFLGYDSRPGNSVLQWRTEKFNKA